MLSNWQLYSPARFDLTPAVFPPPTYTGSALPSKTISFPSPLKTYMLIVQHRTVGWKPLRFVRLKRQKREWSQPLISFSADSKMNRGAAWLLFLSSIVCYASGKYTLFLFEEEKIVCRNTTKKNTFFLNFTNCSLFILTKAKWKAFGDVFYATKKL